jgi:hypothetical protein
MPVPVNHLLIIFIPSNMWKRTTPTRPPYPNQLRMGHSANPTLTNSKFISEGEKEVIGGLEKEGAIR